MLLLIPCFTIFAHMSQKAQIWMEQTLEPGLTVSAPLKLTKSPQKSDSTSLVKSTLWEAETKGYMLFVEAGVIKDPEKTSTSSLMSDTASNLVESESDLVLGSRDILLQGWPGLAVSVKQKDGSIVAMHFFRMGSTAVSLVAVFDAAKPRPAEVDRFLDSLHLPSNGTQNIAGPELSRFPLGDSGLSALFPSKPEADKEDVKDSGGSGTIYSFNSDFSLRNFTVGFQDISIASAIPLVGNKLTEAESKSTENLVGSLKGKKVLQRSELVGKYKALYTEYAFPNKAKVRVLIYLVESRFIFFLIADAMGYDDPKTADLFFHSVEDSRTTTAWPEQTFGNAFTISAPGKFEKGTNEKPDASLLTFENWSLRNGNLAFVLGVSQFKDGSKLTSAAMLSGAVRGFANRTEVKITTEVDLLIQGLQGIELVGLLPDSGIAIEVKFFKVADKLVFVECAYPPASPRPTDVDKFFNSLRFTTDGVDSKTGPVMTRSQLGETGISALFPATPKYRESKFGPADHEKTSHSYEAVYGLRFFNVSYIDVPAEEASELNDDNVAAAESIITEEFLQGLHAKKLKQMDDKVGISIGLATEFEGPSIGKGKLLMYLHGSRMIITFMISGTGPVDTKFIDSFLHSVEFKP